MKEFMMNIIYQKSCFFCNKKMAKYEGDDYFLPHRPDSDAKFTICEDCNKKVKEHGKMDYEIFTKLKEKHLGTRYTVKKESDK